LPVAELSAEFHAAGEAVGGAEREVELGADRDIRDGGGDGQAAGVGGNASGVGVAFGDPAECGGGGGLPPAVAPSATDGGGAALLDDEGAGGG